MESVFLEFGVFFKLFCDLCAMTFVQRYDLEELENDYRNLTAKGDREAALRMKSFLDTIRYDLRMEMEVILEYRSGMEKPLVMRILRNEKDLDRWVAQRFVRLGEF